jgi:hypothetical protein
MFIAVAGDLNYHCSAKKARPILSFPQGTFVSAHQGPMSLKKLTGKDTPTIWTVTIAALIILEICFILFFRTREYPRVWNELGLFTTSLAIGFVLLLKYWNKDVVYIRTPKQSSKTLRIASLVTLTAGAIVFIIVSAAYLHDTPINPNTSDIIPLMQVAVQRFLNGEQVYKAVTQWGGSSPVTYLPMQWLPYTVAEMARFDYRWVAIAIFLSAAFSALLRSSKVSGMQGIVVALMLLFTGWMILQHERGIVATTVELMIAAYYMFFVLSLGARNPWMRGIAMGLCLLSRYSLVLWLPLWAFVELVSGNRKAFVRTSAVALAMVVFLYILPFLSKDWTAFGAGCQYYTKAAVGEWQHLNAEGNPAHLYLGIGFARWFYEYLPGYDIAGRVHLIAKDTFAALYRQCNNNGCLVLEEPP